MTRSRASAPHASAPRKAPQHQTSHAQAPHNPPAPAPAQPQVIHVVSHQPSRGSGMLGTMMGVAGGSVIGHGVSSYLFGGNTQAPTQPAEAQSLASAASSEGHVCAAQLGGYSKCLENSTAEQCKWAWDYFLECQERQTPKAPA